MTSRRAQPTWLPRSSDHRTRGSDAAGVRERGRLDRLAAPRNVVGSAACLAQSEANLRATSIASADDYAVTDPWHTYLCRSKGTYDCLWVYGREAQNMRALVGPDGPVWEFVETGTNDLGLSSEWWQSRRSERFTDPGQICCLGGTARGANGFEWFWTAAARRHTDLATTALERHDPIQSFLHRPHGRSLRSADQRSGRLGRAQRPQLQSGCPDHLAAKGCNGTTYLFVESDRNGTTTGRYP